jgi:transposase-like protein
MGTKTGGRRKEIEGHVRCSCCGRTRFWTELATFTTDLSSEFDLAPGTLTQMVLYCRDDSECRGTAQTLRLLHSAPVAAPGDLCRGPSYRAK